MASTFEIPKSNQHYRVGMQQLKDDKSKETDVGEGGGLKHIKI